MQDRRATSASSSSGHNREELPEITDDGAAEVADPVGEAAGCCAGIVGDLGKLVDKR